MSNRSFGFLALCATGVLLATVLMILRSDSVEEDVQTRADGIRAESDFDSVPGSGLEELEPLPREGRMPVPEDRPQGTEASGDLRLGESVGTALTYPVELRMLPESSLAEITHKRDAIQEHLTGLTEPIFEQRFREGKFERLSSGMERRYEESVGQHSELSSTRRGWDSTRDGNVIRYFSTLDRTALPRSEYPELYFLTDEVERLNRSIQELALAEYYERKAAQTIEAPR